MYQEHALVPQYVIQRGNKILDNALFILAGIVSLSLLAQIAIPLPWTPVPITGQTFGVALISLMWGRKRSVAIVLIYLSIGSLGLPVFAQAKSGFMMWPTAGYLIGMVFASYWMGLLADIGWTKTFLRTWLSAFSGSLIIFFFGVLVLSFFIPSKDLLIAGVLPFLPGDFIKTFSSSLLAYKAQQSFKSKR
ncbi:MAG: biotin transporter BioY [Bdellovibrionota bacterium]